MIIWIFLIWITLSIALLFLGFWTQDEIIQTIAFGILWIPAFAISGINAPIIDDTPGIQYIHGFNSTTTYTYDTNTTGQNDDILSTQESHTPITQTYHNRLYGILLIFASVFGMILSVASMRGVNDYEGPSTINWRRFWK